VISLIVGARAGHGIPVRAASGAQARVGRGVLAGHCFLLYLFRLKVCRNIEGYVQKECQL
jgi:hypothetical protein